MKTKLQIKSVLGNVLFTHECEDNTIAKTVEEAVKNYANLNSADLSYADLSYADLSYANLNSANLRYANLRCADLSSANLRSADLSSSDLSYADLNSANLRYANLNSANLSYANLRSANLNSADLRYADLSSADLSYADLSYADLRYAKHIPNTWVFQSSRDILFILQSMKNEVPFLKEKLIAGKVNGQVYSGDCACLIGTIGKANGSDETGVCNHIPFYELGTHNLGEAFFLNIKEGDTPENSIFVKHAVSLCDMVISGIYTTNNPWTEPEKPKVDEDVDNT